MNPTIWMTLLLIVVQVTANVSNEELFLQSREEKSRNLICGAPVTASPYPVYGFGDAALNAAEQRMRSADMRPNGDIVVCGYIKDTENLFANDRGYMYAMDIAGTFKWNTYLDNYDEPKSPLCIYAND